MRALLHAAAVLAFAITSAFAEEDPGLAISKDGSSVAVTVTTRNVMIRDGSTGDIRWQINRGKLNSETGSTFSKNGSLLYVIGDDPRISGFRLTVLSVSTATGEIVNSFSGTATGRRQLVLTARDKFLITDGGPRQLQVWNVRERRLSHQIITSLSEIENIDFAVTQDSRYVFVAMSDQRVLKFDVATGTLVAETGPLFRIRSIVPHDRGRSLVVTGADIAEIDPATLNVKKSLGRTARAAASAGSIVATCNVDTDIKIRNRQLQPIRNIFFKGDCDELAMSSDGLRLAVRMTTGKVRMYDVETGIRIW